MAGGEGGGGAAAAEGGEKKADDPQAAGVAERGDAAVGEDDNVFIGATKKIAKEDFECKCKSKCPERGETAEERMHWTRPRRWDVRLWNVRVANISDTKVEAFANIAFGGNKEEYLVKTKDNGSQQIWVAGDLGIQMKTPLVSDEPGDAAATELAFDHSFEWFGSYMDLEDKTLRIEMWNYSRWVVNKFDSSYEKPLITFAKGPITHEAKCMKLDRFGNPKPRVMFYFNLYFQEIYDFELRFNSFRVTDLRTCRDTLDYLAAQEAGQHCKGGAGASRVQDDDDDDDDHDAEAVELAMQRLDIVTPKNGKHWVRSSNLSTSTDAFGKECDFPEHGRVHFRGTISDLHNSVILATLYSAETAQELGLKKRPKGSTFTGWVPHCAARIPLTGILKYGDVKGELYAAPWFYEQPGGDMAYKYRGGSLHGNVAIENRPRFQQSSDVSDEIDSRNRYLFVKVVMVDRVTTPDTRPPDSIDTWVEATFDGVTKRTRMAKDEVSPTYNDTLIFDLVLAVEQGKGRNDPPAEPRHINEEIERKGPVHFDLWTEGPASNEHLGSCEIFVNEILVDEKGQNQKVLTKSYKDRHLNSTEHVDVRCFRGMKKLKYTWGPGADSHLFVEMWFLPGLDPQAVLNPMQEISDLPRTMAQKFSEWLARWTSKVKQLGGLVEKPVVQRSEEYEEEDEEDDKKIRSSKISKLSKTSSFLKMEESKRIFPVSMPDQWFSTVALEKAKKKAAGLAPGRHFLPRFLSVIKPPRGIANANAVLHYISCLPYMQKLGEEDILYTPDFVSLSRKGDVFDHAIFQASLLLGLMQRSFVCVGTSLKGNRHAWVMTFEADGSVKFWEPYMRPGYRRHQGTPGTYVLPDRFAHPEFVVTGEPNRKLSKDSLQEEVKRRERLAKQRQKDATNRTLMSPKKAHEHDMVYADCSNFILASTTCSKCSARGRTKAYLHGFHCIDDRCGCDICWKCADQFFEDKADSGTFDHTKPFDFEFGLPTDERLFVPYRSIEVVFNQTNVWANLQHQDPTLIFYDLWNSNYWQPFTPKVEGTLTPCFRTAGLFREAGPRDEGWLTNMRKDILVKLHGAIRGKRSESNLETQFVRNSTLLAFLEAGLELYADLDMWCDERHQSELAKRLQQWRAILRSKTPPRHKTEGMPLHFNFCDPDMVAEGILEHCPMVSSRSKSSQYALALHLVPLPGDIVSLYVYVCEIHRLSEIEMQDEKTARKQGGRSELAEQKDAVKQALAAVAEVRQQHVNALLSQKAAPKPAAPAKSLPKLKPGGKAAAAAPAEEQEQEPQPDEGDYFEVKVTRLAEGQRDGLTLSVTTKSWKDIPGLPDTIDEDNEKSGGKAKKEKKEKKEKQKKKGNKEKIQGEHRLKSPSGPPAEPSPASVQVEVEDDEPSNEKEKKDKKDKKEKKGKKAGKEKKEKDKQAKTGRTREEPDLQQLQQQQQPPQAEMEEEDADFLPPAPPLAVSGFEARLVAKGVRLAADGCTATVLPKVEDGSRVLLGSASLPRGRDGSATFSILVTKVAKELMPEGMVVGVTASSPSSLSAPPDSSDEVPSSWLAGLDGAVWDGRQWGMCPWQPSKLAVGDVVVVSVTEEQIMQILINHEVVASVQVGVGPEVPLYPLLELAGATLGGKFYTGNAAM